MRTSKLCLTILSLLLVSVLTLMTGCSTKIQAKDLMQGITPNSVTVLKDLSEHNVSATDFAIRLFKECNEDGKTTLISPLSVMCAISMTANGTDNDTKKQIEQALGMTTDQLNLYLYSYVNTLPQSKKYKLSLANSIWLNSNRNFEANQNFLQTNADYYNASLYRTPFDNQTKNDINNWVNTHTDEMIPEILDRISPDALMYLINALAFEAEWHNTYNKNQVLNGDFIRSDGTTVKTDFMYSEESAYLEDKNATGFIKYYYEGKYAFVALLPNENLTLSEYVATLDGEKIADLLSNPQQTVVNAAIPKFQTEYKVEMSDMLKNMGIVDAFDASKADFSKIGNSQNGNIYIDSVLHKTYISVMEKGTKAGAVTAIQIKDTCLPVETKTVHLNRPFVYMLIDCENNLPFFIGSLTDITK